MMFLTRIKFYLTICEKVLSCSHMIFIKTTNAKDIELIRGYPCVPEKRINCKNIGNIRIAVSIMSFITLKNISKT